MAAGLGFKDFTTGEVLTAADVDGYLMQGIWVFASAAARDAAVTSPQEGNFAFLKDTNTTTYYTGSAWTNLDTTGMVNPMTTTGDTIYSSSGSTPARLGIGTAGQVLTVNSGATAPEWATPASGSTFAGCALYNSVAQSTSNATYQDLTFDSESFDTDGFHSTSSNTSRITIPSGKGGKYHISAVITWSSNSTGIRKVAFRKNGTDFIYPTRVSAVNGDDTAISISTIINLSVADYMTVAAFQNTGGALNCTGFETQIQFTAAYLGA